MEERGHEVVKTSASVDMKKKIDFYVNGVGVDVKGRKSVNSIWLELVNVRGDKGWLEGEADIIAFFLSELNGFSTYKRTDLLRWVRDNITKDTTSSKDYLKWYNRGKWGKKDKIVQVRYDDIKHLEKQLLKIHNG